MTLHPIFAALRKHKSGVVLIAAQIALTLAIVCNAIFIIGHRVQLVRRATGIDENNLFYVQQEWVGAPSADDPVGLEKLDAMQREDLAALRNMPDVDSVTSVNSLPLTQSSSNGQVALKPGANGRGGTARTTYYDFDDQMIKTLGMRMVAGRAFNAGDMQHRGFRDQHEPSVVILTKSLADQLFPHDSAVGKAIYLNGDVTPTTIIGVAANLQSPDPNASNLGKGNDYNATIAPLRIDASFASYAIRAKPGRRDAAISAVRSVLYNANPMRVLDDDDAVRSFSAIRENAYRADVGMAILMGVVCIVLLGVTAAGIVGLTSFWVGQRHRQIGVRRALGARKIDILHYFQLENLIIAGIGAVVGILLAVGLNLILIRHFEMDRMPVLYVLVGVLFVMLLGQIAVYVPARRASNVPPVVATRSA